MPSEPMSETSREVAEQIVRSTLLGDIENWPNLIKKTVDAINAAVEQERERCAKILDRRVSGWLAIPIDKTMEQRYWSRVDELRQSAAEIRFGDEGIKEYFKNANAAAIRWSNYDE